MRWLIFCLILEITKHCDESVKLSKKSNGYGNVRNKFTEDSRYIRLTVSIRVTNYRP